MPRNRCTSRNKNHIWKVPTVWIEYGHRIKGRRYCTKCGYRPPTQRDNLPNPDDKPKNSQAGLPKAIPIKEKAPKRSEKP